MHELLKRVLINDGFIGRYQQLVKESVIPYQEKALRDEIPDIEKSHAIENFRQAAQVIETGCCDGEFYGMVFQDSDVAKWLEAAAYSLALAPDADLEVRCDEVIDLIGRAQHKDGYLNTYFTVKMPDQRWTNLYECHELYCAGHMIEAAVAYYECTGKRKLLDIMCRMADHMVKRFIVNDTPGYPGHPEVELALMRLYEATSNEDYLALCARFVDLRGVDSAYFEKETNARGWRHWGGDGKNTEYGQNHMPVRDMDKAVGHAVRAVYLYTGMAHLAKKTGESTLVTACKRLFQNIVDCRMYVTGAIGSVCEGEAFSKDYHLPNDSAYAETCAAIGLIFFGRRMLELETDSVYGDAMERALYNCVLAGMELDGKRFFYVNPLEVVPGISGEAQNLKHSLPQRPGWFGCACCPPNVSRLLLSIGAYAWGEKEDTVYSHLFMGGELMTHGGAIKVQTGYPYEGGIHYTFSEDMAITLAVRVPGWSSETTLTLNDQAITPETHNGYAYLPGPFKKGDQVTLTLNMAPYRVFANPMIAADSGRVAFMRGPIVYCAEGIDNQGEVLNLFVKKDESVINLPYNCNLLSGCVIMEVPGSASSSATALYSKQRPAQTPCRITLIPYYTWGNRGLSAMRVWLPET